MAWHLAKLFSVGAEGITPRILFFIMPSLAKPARSGVVACVLAVALAGGAAGQVSPGLPNFSAFDSHEVDAVNLMNNNVFLSIPLMSKEGIIPINLGVNGNYYVTTQGGSTWKSAVIMINGQPTISSGPVLGTTFGLAVAASTSVPCQVGTGYTTKSYNWVLITGDGAAHYLPITDFTDTTGTGTSCLTGSGFTDKPLDGTPVTIVMPPYGGYGTMYGKDGSQLTASQISDVNGNQISASLDVTDTLGLKAAHVGAWYGFTAPVSWTDVSGGNPEVNFSTSSKTLKTTFGCTSPLITDLNNTTANALLTGLSFPDGSSIALSYEITPNNSPKVTGRLNQITLREGGTISYTYGGGTHNGIDCTYQTVPVLTRTLGNGDQTTYSLAYSLVSGSNYKATNTVLDAGGNTTIYTFTGFTSGGNSGTYAQVLTDIKRYQGTSTVLSEDVSCYKQRSPIVPSVALPQHQLPIQLLRSSSCTNSVR